MRNPLSWLAIVLVVPFNKVPPFSKDLISFILSFISLFVSVIHVPKIPLKSGKPFREISAVFIKLSNGTRY